MSQAQAQAPLQLKGDLRQTLATDHKKGISMVKFSPDGAWLASASADKTVKLWHVVEKDYTLGSTLQGVHRQGISDIAWSHDSAYIATASDDMTVVVWNVQTGKPMRRLSGHTNYVFCVAFNPQSTLIASGAFDETVRVWDVKEGKCLKTLPAHSDPITSVVFSPDGTLIVSASYDGLIRIWDTSTGQCLKTLMNDDDHPSVAHVRFTPNGKFILASTLDGHHRLWSFMPTAPAGPVAPDGPHRTGQGNAHGSGPGASSPRERDMARCVKTYRGHVNQKYCLAAGLLRLPQPAAPGAPAHEACYVVSGSECGAVYVWEVQSRRVVARLVGHTDVVISVSVHPTLPMIASGALQGDRTIKLWHMTEALADADMVVEG